MDAELDQRPAIDRYRSLLHWLENPHFNSVEEAEENLTDELTFFVVLDRGFYTIYRVSNNRRDVSASFSFPYWRLAELRRDAAIELGEQSLVEMCL